MHIGNCSCSRKLWRNWFHEFMHRMQGRSSWALFEKVVTEVVPEELNRDGIAVLDRCIDARRGENIGRLFELFWCSRQPSGVWARVQRKRESKNVRQSVAIG